MKIQQKGSEAQWAFTVLLEIYFFENKSFVPMQHPLINLTPQWWRSTGNLCINACISHINNFWVPKKLWNSKVSKVQPCMRAYLIAYKATRHITNYSSVVHNVFVLFLLQYWKHYGNGCCDLQWGGLNVLSELIMEKQQFVEG